MFTSFETDQKKSLSSSLVLSTAVEILSEIVEAVSFAPETILLNSQFSLFSGFIGVDCWIIGFSLCLYIGLTYPLIVL